MKKINTKEEFDKIINEDYVLIDFYADWCGPCKMLFEVLDEIDKEQLIDIYELNVDNFGSIAREYRVFSIPNLKIFHEGKVIKEKTGLMMKEELLEFIKRE